jgi:tRNA-uridine 2-sulfurtransferase
MARAMIAMSGGVDSSVAACLMLERGFECMGVTMRLFDTLRDGTPDDSSYRTCCSLDDVEDARRVCNQIGIPHYVFDFKQDFEEAVITPFIETYQRGDTPNPCIACNRHLKFTRLFDRMEEVDCDYLVTGHYARRDYDEARMRYTLHQALDATKDQSYVLYMLTQRQLERVDFPLGSVEKSEVRRIAAQRGFLNAHKPESQDICFVPDGDYAAFLERRGIPVSSGPILDLHGYERGRHNGLYHYTIGQRKGIGVPSVSPYYVIAKDMDRNALIIGFEEDTFVDEIIVANVNWLSINPPEDSLSVQVKTRYRQEPQRATLIRESDHVVRLAFPLRLKSPAPGQAAVFYGDGSCYPSHMVLGGGTLV